MKKSKTWNFKKSIQKYMKNVKFLNYSKIQENCHKRARGKWNGHSKLRENNNGSNCLCTIPIWAKISSVTKSTHCQCKLTMC